MNRWREINETLRRIEESGDTAPELLGRRYARDVRYLVRRLDSYGPPLRTKLQKKGLELAESQVRYWFLARMTAGLGLVLAISITVNFLMANGRAWDTGNLRAGSTPS